jgi:HAD superfamily hydrolase (TIGR01509 family)
VTPVTTVVFDLGNVLIGWSPERVYRELIDDPQQRQRFLDEVCSPAWHDRQDRGRSLAEGTAELVARYPDQAELIEAFYGRWSQMFAPMPASVDVLRELREAGVRLVALTNWPAEPFAQARSDWPFLDWFEGIVVSGQAGVAKPDAAVFQLVFDTYDVDPTTAVYVDDTPEHVAAGSRLGMHALRFTSAVQLRRDLAAAGLPVHHDTDIRPGQREDLPELTAIYNHHVETSPSTFDLEPWRPEQRLSWLDHYAPIGRHRLLVATRAGAVIGYATSSSLRPKRAYDPSVEVTVYLAEGSQGRGIGSMLYQELFAALAGEDVHRAFAAIAVPNDASVALHRRFGFVDVGVLHEVGRKFDQWWDVLWLQRGMP